MIIFDLICLDANHRFEGWFGSSQDYADQHDRGLLDCPVCGSKNIAKAAMAPNLGRKGNQAPVSRESTEAGNGPHAEPVTSKVPVPAEYKELIGKLAKAQAKMLANSEWVGDRFAARARDIHYGPPTYLYNGKFNSFAAAFATANDTPKIALAPSLDLLAVPSISHICLSIYSCSKTETPINS